MSLTPPAAGPLRRPRAAVPVRLLTLLLVLAGASGCGSSTATSTPAGPAGVRRTAAAHVLGAPLLRGARPSRQGVADGEVPRGTTVFSSTPAVANLDPALRDRLRSAGSAAARDGVVLGVNSGWRSRSYQEQLFDDAVARYGSVARAEQWVARPGTSVHEAGDAVDVGPVSAASWLARHGARFGLCLVYLNEPWHFELRTDAVEQGCPRVFTDPTHDPRLQQ